MGSKTFGLVRPCPKCPFRTDVPPYLRPERVTEIATDVQGGATFYCHQTTVPVDDDEDGGSEMREDANSMACAGSLILMEKQEAPNQSMRIAERLGAYDRTRLDMDAPVHSSWVAMQAHFAEEEGDPCSVVGWGCEAPAGYMIDGAVVAGTEYATETCIDCGDPVCSTCLRPGNRCEACADANEEE